MRKIVVKVGNLLLGTGDAAVVQTMCNTSTADIEKSVEQCIKLSNAGARLIRLTTQGIKETDALKEIKSRLLEKGISTPLVADVHFSPEVAAAAARVADKVRINPGNFAKDHSSSVKEFSKLVTLCKELGKPLRIGINHGSLGRDITERYGDSPRGMKEAALEWLDMAHSQGYDQIVISLKSSNTLVMVTAYRLLFEEFKKRGICWPLHLGITEAGNSDAGRIKSAAGISALLKDGIGDTIRVSLTEDPLNEIPVASFISDYFHKKLNGKDIDILTGNAGVKIARKNYKCDSWEEFILSATCDLGPLLIDRVIDDVEITALIDNMPKDRSVEGFRADLLQATGRLYTKPEYIACPGCGRTLYNLEAVFEEVKRRTSHLKGYKIAVMGCIVNGPGEMADADYGYVGEGRNRVSIYRGKEVVYRNVPENEAIGKLLLLIEEDARNRDALRNFL